MRFLMILVAAISLVATPAFANELEVSILKLSDGGAGFEYEMHLEATKSGASECSLSTPKWTYTCAAVIDGTLTLPAAFLSDHSGLSFAQLLTTIETDWTLTWDPGEGTETVATICFGSIVEANFLEHVPILSHPVDDSREPPTTGMIWGYGKTAACTAQRDRVEAGMFGPAGAERGSDELACSVTSWMPSTALTAGQWTAMINNGHDPGLVVSGWIEAPDGTSCAAPTGDPWPLLDCPASPPLECQSDWLSLENIDRATFAVANQVPALSKGGTAVLGGVLLLAGVMAVRRIS